MLRNTKIIESKKNFYGNKNLDTYPKILNDEIKLLAFDKNNAKLIGSSSYKSQKYPSDIDISEKIVTCCSKEEGVEFFYNGIRSIVQRVSNMVNHWVLELKCGIDERFNLENITDIAQWLKINEGLMNHEDVLTIEAALKLEDKDLGDEIVVDVFRKYYIIRWSVAQVLSGYQMRSGVTFFLRNCIDTISLINLEVIVLFDGKFMDISNFYILAYHDKISGKDLYINFNYDILTESTQVLKDGLCDSINQLYCSKIKRNLFKVVKRLFSLIRIDNDKTLYKLILPIIESDISPLYQLKSELDTLYRLANFTRNFPKDVFIRQLDSIKWRFGGNMYSNNDFLENTAKSSQTYEGLKFEEYFVRNINMFIKDSNHLFENLYVLKDLSNSLRLHINSVLDHVFDSEKIIDQFHVGNHLCFKC